MNPFFVYFCIMRLHENIEVREQAGGSRLFGVLADLLRLALAQADGGSRSAGTGDGVTRLRNLGSLTEEEWRELLRLANRQDVVAVAWDGIGRLAQELRPPRSVAVGWAVHAAGIETRYEATVSAAEWLGDFSARRGLPEPILLKGLGLSACYPVPSHRRFADVDIFLPEGYRKLDRALAAEGIPVCDDFHHHTVFVVRHVMFENHFTLLDGASCRSNRRLERSVLRCGQGQMRQVTVGKSRFGALPVTQEAIFLMRHAAVHFAARWIRLRDVCDWTVFVRRHAGDIDWAEFWSVCREFNFHRFAAAVCRIASRRLGADERALRIPADALCGAEELALRIEADMAACNTQTPPPRRAMLLAGKLKRYLGSRWKRRVVYSDGEFSLLVNSLWAKVRKPRSLLLRK